MFVLLRTGASPAVHLTQAHRRRDASGHEERSQSERDAAVQHHVHVSARERQVSVLRSPAAFHDVVV